MSHIILTKHNGFVCTGCGSDRFGYVCHGCQQMVCSCREGCDYQEEREREEEERHRILCERERMHDEIDSGYWDR